MAKKSRKAADNEGIDKEFEEAMKEGASSGKEESDKIFQDGVKEGIITLWGIDIPPRCNACEADIKDEDRFEHLQSDLHKKQVQKFRDIHEIYKNVALIAEQRESFSRHQDLKVCKLCNVAIDAFRYWQHISTNEHQIAVWFPSNSKTCKACQTKVSLSHRESHINSEGHRKALLEYRTKLDERVEEVHCSIKSKMNENPVYEAANYITGNEGTYWELQEEIDRISFNLERKLILDIKCPFCSYLFKTSKDPYLKDEMSLPEWWFECPSCGKFIEIEVNTARSVWQEKGKEKRDPWSVKIKNFHAIISLSEMAMDAEGSAIKNPDFLYCSSCNSWVERVIAFLNPFQETITLCPFHANESKICDGFH
jgi:hypothetical protein